jgi:tetratricopeptide (TPR) repeat protein
VEDRISGTLTYSFRQKIFKEIILLELSATRKRLLHRRLAAAIEDRIKGSAEKQAAILAGHYQWCGDYEKAFTYWKMNAEYAKKLSSPGDAFRSFQNAHTALNYIDGMMTDEQIAEFYLSWAELAYFSVNSDELLRIHNQLMKLGKDRSSSLLLGDSLACLANQQFCLKQYSDGLVTTELMLRYYHDSGSTARWLTGVNRKAKFLYMLSRVQEAKEVIDSAMESLPPSLDTETLIVQANLLYDSALLLCFLGNPLESISLAEKSLKCFMQAHEVEGQAKVYGVLTLAHVYTGENQKAESEGELGLQLAEKINYIRMQGYILNCLASAKLGRGKLDESWEMTSRAKSIGDAYQYPEISVVAERTYGDIYHWLGDFPRAIEFYRSADRLSSDALIKYDNLSRLGFLLCLTGNLGEGKALVSEADKAANQMSMRGLAISTQLYQLLADRDLNLQQQKIPLLQDLLQECEQRGLATQWGMIMGMLIRLDYLQNMPHQAEEKISRLISRGQEYETLWMAILSQMVTLSPSHESDKNSIWENLLTEYLQRLENYCQTEPVQESFMLFRKNIDKY